MDVRKATAEDLRPLAELWAYAFPGERTVADRMRQLELGYPYGGLDVSWLAESNGRLTGAFRAYRLVQYLSGTPMPMLGLAAVATAPTDRRRGVARALCRHAIRIGRERGDLVSVLYPFRPSFYRALGWGFAGILHAHRFAPGALPDYDEAAHVRPAGADDRAAIAACYARVAADSNGLIERNVPIWSYHFERPGTYAVVYDDGAIRGYALARFARGATPEGGSLRVDELVAESDEAYRGLLGWIAAQRDQVRLVLYDARPDEELDLRLDDPRPPGYRPARNLWYPTAQRLRGPMIRILDVGGALAARTQWGETPGLALTIEIEIDDAEVPENRGPWTVAIEDGGARVHRSRGAGADARLETDAATFAEIYAGALLPSAAARLGRARIDGAAEALDRAVAVRRPFWLLDEF
jgi:predicted acetyltransferase